MKWKRIYFVLSIFCIGFSVIFLTGCWIYNNFGTLLVVESREIKSVDIIFVFNGENERLIYADSLRIHFENTFLLISASDSIDAKTTINNYFHENTRIGFIYGCKNTFEEVNEFAKYAKKLDKKALKAGFISSPWHMRRIWLISHRFLWRTGIQCRYYPVPDNYYKKEWSVKRSDLVNWEERKYIKNFVINAWLENGFDFVRTYFPFINDKLLLKEWKKYSP